MLTRILKQPVFGIITILGCFFMFLGLFKVEDITKLAVSPLSQPFYPSVAIGAILTTIGVVLYVALNMSISTFAISSVRRLTNGYSIAHGRLVLNVLFGRIETFDCSGDESMTALPTNEFFDDDCISDTGSALGGYMHHHFKGNISEIQAIVKKVLQNLPSEEVEREPGNMAPSYGVGKCIYLDHTLFSRHHIALVAVTTKRTNEGLQADARYVLDGIASIQREMANHRHTSLNVPLLGCGHGGLKGEVSLVCMLIAFTELHRRSLGHHLKNVNIVVFTRDNSSAPSISRKNIKRALALASRLLEE